MILLTMVFLNPSRDEFMTKISLDAYFAIKHQKPFKKKKKKKGA